LLLSKKQLNYLDDQVHRDGQTIVPLKVYIKNRVAKLLIGLAKGKRQVDRRNTIKERDAKREIDRAMKSRI
jgi:SsrA-binding protein